MNHHYNDITGTMTAQLRQLHRATRSPTQPCFDVIDNEGLCLCVVIPRWWDAHGTPRFCDHHPQHSADIYATEVALLRISCQGCGHEFLVQMTNGLWETAQEMVRQGIADRPARILDRLMTIARDEPRGYADELDNLATEISALRHPKVPTLADLARDGTIHYGDPPNIGCCPAGPTMNCWDLAVVEFWNHTPLGEWKRGLEQWQRVPELERDLPDMTAEDRLERL